MATRPLGIAILSMFLFVIGTIIIVAGLVLVVFSGIIAAAPQAAEEVAKNLSQLPGIPFGMHTMISVERILVFMGIMVLFMGIIMAVIGWGLWKGANWARWIAIIYFGWNTLTSLINLVQGQIGSIISLAVNGLILYYLFQPHVKEFFKAAV